MLSGAGRLPCPCLVLGGIVETRKRLRLPTYDYRQDGAYFVTICTKERRNCLSQVVGADAHIGPHTALTGVGEIAERYIQTIPGIDKYVIMPNHIHMIVLLENGNGSMWASTPTKSLSDIVRSFKVLTSKAAGNSLWQCSFYDHVIRNEQEYLQIWQYIDDNPANWAEDEYYSESRKQP